ncbi:HalOD1 output domain-containing protein [Halopiger xanaduensis]|uniref:Halobacterial output domain-containing protein n=1 Tax=Halopiger xanaduensis (strain DSM 18323 / JCM 14033 / SH-6) TaxID=797210 RepID=F8D4I0_HALXS|nr:HalOD1 output domain-containing protein [Halopiger xanaduensis]AEH36308.1 hypothetical protein Halxa_1676 [Halopiger xanaduensis SH-6]
MSSVSNVVIRHRFDWSNTSPSSAIIAAIAAIENVNPMHLDLVLYRHIDPTALDTLVATDERIAVSFSLDDYLISIEGSDLTVRNR